MKTRWLIGRDLTEVMQIEHASFEYFLTEEEFLQVLQQRHVIAKVAINGKVVVGFMVYELNKDIVRLLDFAVHPTWRRKKVGTFMIDSLINILSKTTRSGIMLEVRETNLSAQIFFREQKFVGVKVLRKFFDDSGEDAYIMEYRCKKQLFKPVNRIFEAA